MTQALFNRKRLSYLSPQISRLPRLGMLLLLRPEVRKWGRWSLASCGVTLMYGWDWKLVLATAAGVGGMGLVYLALGENWQKHWLVWQQYFKGSQGKLTLAVGSGGLAALSTYMAATIWTDSENRWLATAMIAEGMGTLLTLSLLGWHILGQKSQPINNQFDSLLQQLTASNPLQRLLAVRQLSKQYKNYPVNSSEHQETTLYFQYLLNQETDLHIRQAILDFLRQKASESSSLPPLQNLVDVQTKTRLKINQSIY
ncbi:MAG: hypothetical protein ACRC6M_18660 [Microcystaceae cyanobacterium]